MWASNDLPALTTADSVHSLQDSSCGAVVYDKALNQPCSSSFDFERKVMMQHDHCCNLTPVHFLCRFHLLVLPKVTSQA